MRPEHVDVFVRELKLEWYRAGGEVSERQWRDVQGILVVQGENLDFDYLHRWAEELNVNDLLERALRDCVMKDCAIR